MSQGDEGAHRTPRGKRAAAEEINIIQKQQSMRKQTILKKKTPVHKTRAFLRQKTHEPEKLTAKPVAD